MSNDKGRLVLPPTYDTQLGLIADHYLAAGEPHRADVIRQGTLDEAVQTLLLDLGNLALRLDLARLDASRAEDRALAAEKRLAVLTQPMAPELARLDACIRELDGRLDKLRLAAHDGLAAVFKALREMPTGFGDLDDLPPIERSR